MAGPVNLTVPGGAAGEAALPLRLLDGFSLYVMQSDGSELLAGLEQLENGAVAATCYSDTPASACMYAICPEAPDPLHAKWKAFIAPLEAGPHPLPSKVHLTGATSVPREFAGWTRH